MLLLTSALKIATEKVLSTIYNIVVFRNVYSLIQIWLSGVYAFIAVVYITPRVKEVIATVFRRLKSVFVPRIVLAEQRNAFDRKYLRSVELDLRNEASLNDETSPFLERVRTQSQSDIFSYIFTCSSKSSLLNLFTIIAVEYLHSTYEYNVVYAIFCCVCVTFVICFGASFRYASILSDEWLEFLENEKTAAKKQHQSGKSKNILLVYEKEEDTIPHAKEFVCLWTCKYDSESRISTVELKFLSAKFSKNLKDLIEFYAEKHLVLEQPATVPPTTTTTTENVSLLEEEHAIVVKAQNYKLILPEYYDEDLALTKCAKSKGFKNDATWKEFNIFPLIDVKISTYSNYSTDTRVSKKKAE